MTELTVEKLTPTVGAQVMDVDVDRLLNDEDLPRAVLAAAEEHGVLLFREVHLDDHALATFSKRLGEVIEFPGYDIPEVIVVSMDPDNPNADYYKGNMQWHIDDTHHPVIAKATLLTAHKLSPEGGETEFISTYAAYDDLSEDEKVRYANLRVHHSLEPIEVLAYENPTPEQLAKWRQKTHEQPLVWTHDSGRKSLVIGLTADYVVEMDVDEGRALLADLNARSTAPDRVFRHTWSVGDLLLWDNLGTLHRALPYDLTCGREMHRTSVLRAHSMN